MSQKFKLEIRYQNGYENTFVEGNTSESERNVPKVDVFDLVKYWGRYAHTSLRIKWIAQVAITTSDSWEAVCSRLQSSAICVYVYVYNGG